MKKVAIHNLGCKVNSYEAESMEQMLINAGYKMVPFNEETIADIYIINTCSVTNIADRKSRQMLHKAKKMNPDAIVIAAGCYVQANAENVEKDDAVDIVLGNNCKANILEVIDNYYENGTTENLVNISEEQPFEEMKIDSVSEHTRAYIKIQDGCNQFCSYCIIPYVRGRIRSRDMDEVVSEVKRLVEHGYKEVVLTGIHLSSYGLDNNKGSLLEVIKRVDEIDGLERIRLGSLEPRVITEEFAETISKMDKMCPHFHLSLQSGSNATLKRMNRKYSAEEYYDKCCLLRKYFDDPAITTDVIVGFPGETEEEFEETCEFLKKVHFYEMHIFKYSRRKGTVADRMPDQVDDKIKSERSGILLEMAKNMSLEYREAHLGKEMDVLFEEVDEDDLISGYTKNYLRVSTEKKLNNVNDIVHVKLDSMHDEIIIKGTIV